MSSTLASHPRRIMAGCVAFGILAVGLLAAGPGAEAAPMKGTMIAATVKAEKKKCNSEKGKAKKACLKGAEGRAKSKVRKMMSTTKGLYGFGISRAGIPARKGTLIWSKPLAPVENAAKTEFVLYSSRSYPSNQKIVVSGTVSVPKGNPPAGGKWPVITWAHGTTGLADGCAPSRGGDQGSYGGAEPLVAHWLASGYAVVATDYEGLGTPGIHPYLVGDSEARGILDIVRAGRMAFPSLDKDNVAIAGHSQGGQAALFAAHNAPDWGNDLKHRGTVAYAPASKLLQQVPLLSAPGLSTNYGLAALATSILRGAVAADRNIKPEQIMTDAAYELYPMTETVCLGELGEEFAARSIGPDDLLRPGWSTTLNGKRFEKVLVEEMDPDLVFETETMIPQGLQDTTVFPPYTNALISSLEAKNPGLIQYVTYGNADGPDHLTPGPSTHGSVLADSLTEVDEFLYGLLVD